MSCLSDISYSLNTTGLFFKLLNTVGGKGVAVLCVTPGHNKEEVVIGRGGLNIPQITICNLQTAFDIRD